MRGDLIDQRPDVVKAWLNAELDAQLFMADPANTMAVVKMAGAQTTGFDDYVLWKAMVGSTPKPKVVQMFVTKWHSPLRQRP